MSVCVSNQRNYVTHFIWYSTRFGRPRVPQFEHLYSGTTVQPYVENP
jgi:hypothetical protein